MDRDFHAFEDEGTPPPRVRKAAARAKARKPSLMRRLLITPFLAGLAALFSLSVRRPIRVLAALCLFGMTIGVVANALYLQQGRHPAPLFAGPQPPQPAPAAPISSSIVAATPPVALPPISTRPPARNDHPPLDPTPMSIAPARPAPAPPAAAAAPAQTTNASMAAQTNAQTNPQTNARAPAPKPPADPIGALIRGDAPVVVNASAQQPTVVGANDPLQSRRIVAVQRALDRLGFQVASDGVLGPGTRAAIQRFERERDLPVTGDLSPRTLRALAARSGVPIP
jgi:hypothetical protein